MFQDSNRYLYIFGIAIYSYFNIKFTQGDELLSETPAEWILILLISIMVLLIWEGDRLIQRTLDSRQLSGYKPLVYLFILSTVWITVVAFISVGLQMVAGMGVDLLSVKLALGFSFRVNLFLNCVNAIVHFQRRFAKIELEAERLKKESLSAQFHALKRQINPHFLFNSLNVLDSLVQSDHTKAHEFIERLAVVYRYLTSNEDFELVKMKDEIEFLENYIYLLKVRFGENLDVQIDVKPKQLDKYLPPAALQMLLENAVKHNEISRQKPLKVRLIGENGSVSVSNSRQPKLLESNSTQTGLENIRTRYEFLNKTIEINKRAELFEVKLPLIEVHD